MDSFEINKIVAAVLVVFLVVFGIGKISDIVFYVEKPTTSAYKVEIVNASTSTGSDTLETVDIAALLAVGDAEHGKLYLKFYLFQKLQEKQLELQLIFYLFQRNP